jgi:hypothetical protein
MKAFNDIIMNNSASFIFIRINMINLATLLLNKVT